MATSRPKMPQIFAPCAEKRPMKPWRSAVLVAFCHHAPIRSVTLRRSFRSRYVVDVAGRQTHDGSLGELCARQFAGDAAFVHHDRAVGQADDFFHLAGREQNGDALAGQLIHEFIDFFLRADVDAAGRLVEQQQFRLQAKPFAEHDLLLVAAGKIAHGHAIVGGLDTHRSIMSAETRFSAAGLRNPRNGPRR